MTSPEISVTDLAYLVMGPDCEDKVIAVIVAYFDDSGTNPEHPAVVVGGCLATVESWVAFQREWRGILEEYHVPHFHMTDFDNRWGCFHRDKFPEENRIPLHRKLINTLKTKTQAFIVAATNKKDYAKVQDFYNGHPPYAYTVYQAIGGVAKWADEHGYEGPIVYVFDKGGGSKALGRKSSLDTLRDNILARPGLARQFRMHRLQSWNYGLMDDLSPLQGADMIAYEAWKDLQNDYFAERPVHWRKSVEKIVSNEHLYTGYFDKDVFMKKGPMWEFLIHNR